MMEDQPIPYGKGTRPCDDCWAIPSRHCCLWNEDERPLTEDEITAMDEYEAQREHI